MLTLWIDGTAPLSAETVKAVEAVCDKAEDQPQSAVGDATGVATGDATGVVTVHVAGTPQAGWTSGLSVALVTKWERVLRRLERLPTPTVAVASEDIGGAALDAFLATDFRIATRESRLLVATDGEATWPGMAAYRLVQQAGAAKIRRAVMFGLPISAPEALTLGIVDELADDAAGVLEATTQLVGRLSGSELAIRRQLLFNATSTSFEDALGPHLAACDRALRRVAAAEAS